MSASHGEQTVPNTMSTALANTTVVGNSADCHMHIYDPRFPETNARSGLNPKNATVADYQLLQQRIWTRRVVVVTPRNYGIDNRVTVDAIKQLERAPEVPR